MSYKYFKALYKNSIEICYFKSNQNDETFLLLNDNIWLPDDSDLIELSSFSFWKEFNEITLDELLIDTLD